MLKWVVLAGIATGLVMVGIEFWLAHRVDQLIVSFYEGAR